MWGIILDGKTVHHFLEVDVMPRSVKSLNQKSICEFSIGGFLVHLNYLSQYRVLGWPCFISFCAEFSGTGLLVDKYANSSRRKKSIV